MGGAFPGLADGVDHRRIDRARGGSQQLAWNAGAHPLRRVSRTGQFGRAFLRPYTLDMVFGASAALTRLGFRRDVRLFLGALVGFLVVLILLLLLLLQTFMRIAEDAVIESWQSVAD